VSATGGPKVQPRTQGELIAYLLREGLHLHLIRRGPPNYWAWALVVSDTVRCEDGRCLRAPTRKYRKGRDDD